MDGLKSFPFTPFQIDAPLSLRYPSNMNRAFILLRLLFLILLPLSSSAEIHYVAPLGAHISPFSTWADAATNIHSALAVCAAGDVVMLTNGVYTLSTTVRVTNEVTLTSLNGRDSALLDATALASGSDAVFLQLGTLDGLTISNAPRHGIKSEHGSIFNSRITHSSQTGIDSYTTPRILTNSTLLVTNTIVEHSGSNGIYTCAVDTRILGCLVTKSAGTGVSLRQNDTVSPQTLPRVSNFLIRASTVSSNQNSGIGLAFWNYDPSLPTVPVRIEGCWIEENTCRRGGGVSDGGGVDTDRSSGVQIVNSIIRKNSATTYGGGVAFLYSRSPSISHSIIEDNTSVLDGGGLSLSSGTMNCCLARNNTAGSTGGGIALWNATVINSTIYLNRAVQKGGGMSDVGGSSIVNSILYYNTADSFPNVSGGSVSYSCSTPRANGAGNIADPPNFAGTLNYRLVPGSPCIDQGTFSFREADYDLDGDPRIWGGGVDMGCDEYYPPGLGGPLSVSVEASTDRAVTGSPISFRCNVEGMPESYVWTFTGGHSVSNTPFVDRTFDVPGTYVVSVSATNRDGPASHSVVVDIFPGYTNFVSPTGLHSPPFTNQTDAATNIQDAIAANIPGGVVRVADGIYDLGGATVNGVSDNRIAITNVLDVISEHGPSHAWIVGQGPCGDTAVRCAYVRSGARLVGFTLTGGRTRAAGDADRDQSGGGAWCESGGILQNCILRDNEAVQSGGGVKGGTVLQSTLSGNLAFHGGGSAAANLMQCILSNNTALGIGGGAGGGTLENVLVVNNQAAYGGGAASNSLRHSTVAGNHASVSGGGIYRSMASNSIVYFNTAGSNWPNFFNSVCTYCCTTPDPQSQGTILDNPLFVDAANGNFQLLENSPAIDAALPTSLNVDLTGMHRPLLGIPGGVPAPDMGAYELLHSTADTDGDGLGDRDEMENHHTDFLLPDTDGDRHSDGAEIIAGMDPLDPGSVFSITQMLWNETGQSIAWPSRAGRLYTVVTADDALGIWTNRADFTDIPGANGSMHFTNAPLTPINLLGVRVRLAP